MREEAAMSMGGRLATVVFATALVIATKPATAQFYTINNVQANSDVTALLHEIGVPFGNYWLNKAGYYGVVTSFGRSPPLGNASQALKAVPRAIVNKLRYLRGPGESYSDAIIRLTGDVKP
jgi:hypothetical protein